MDKKQARTKEIWPYLEGALAGALAGMTAVSPLECIILFGLGGSGHGGPLEGTALAPVAWASLCFGPILGAIAGAVVGIRLVRRRLAKRADQQSTDRVPDAELDRESAVDSVDNSRDPEEQRKAIAELDKRGTMEPLEGDNDD